MNILEIFLWIEPPKNMIDNYYHHTAQMIMFKYWCIVRPPGQDSLIIMPNKTRFIILTRLLIHCQGSLV